MAEALEEAARAFLLLLTFLAIVYWLAHQPPPVQHVQVDYCVQPVWNKLGVEVGGKWVPCSELDRYEEA